MTPGFACVQLLTFRCNLRPFFPEYRAESPIQTKQTVMKNKTNEVHRSPITRGPVITGVMVGVAAALVVLSAQAQQTPGFVTSVQPYAKSISADYIVVPLLSVGDRVPHTSDSTKQFQMIGVPDGLGAHKAGGGNLVLYMNHELAGANQSEPVIGEPLHRGAFLSKFILNAAGEGLSGEGAYDVIVDPSGNPMPPATTKKTTPAFLRFCLGTPARRGARLDHP